MPIISEMRCQPVISTVTGRQLGDLPNHDPAAAAWRGEGRQRGLRSNPDLTGAGGAAELLDAVGVHGGTEASGPQITAARRERVRSLDPDIARVKCEGVAALDAVPLEALEEELRRPLAPKPRQLGCIQCRHSIQC